ncbi:MAG: hypothetical protein V2A66_08710 [Pseudomonadota bacterium]
MITKRIVLWVVLLASLALSACGGDKQPVTAKEREMTLGIVQRDIHKGMSQADVAEALGSPNIVTKDSTGLETWIYDKIATEASYSHKDFYWTLILIGGSRNSGNSGSTQRTLTVVIKFNSKGQVETLSYNSSKF